MTEDEKKIVRRLLRGRAWLFLKRASKELGRTEEEVLIACVEHCMEGHFDHAKGRQKKLGEVVRT